MCGRFALDEKTNDLIEAFVLDGNDYADWIPSFSIAPTDPVPIIRERASKTSGEVLRTVEPAVWDFHPAFIRESKRPNFNARIETVATNGMWKGAFASGRCIVPMRGYYEWTGEAGDKQPHFIHGPGIAQGAPLLAAAGLATARKVTGADGADEWVVSTAIITREARDASGDVHDRMPVFLTPDVFDHWLEPGKLDGPQSDEMLAMLHEVSSGVASTITTYEVDRRVNNSRTADSGDPALIAPVAS
jgi:putative SOS response-associated peptidase YedK